MAIQPLHRVFPLSMLLLLSLALSPPAPAVEKYTVLGFSDLVFTGKAQHIGWTLSFRGWRLTWTLRATVEVSDILKGPQNLLGKRIEYIFRCTECPLLAWPGEPPRFAHNGALWFVRRDGPLWEAAYGAGGDLCFQPACQADSFRRFLRGEHYPYPSPCRPEDWL
jgi:hypothetical protein